nr:MAG TPA: Radical SAM superfamily [Bacteriophage sp.]
MDLFVASYNIAAIAILCAVRCKFCVLGVIPLSVRSLCI